MTFEEWKKSIVTGDGYSAKDAFDAATKAERERCAKLCDNYVNSVGRGLHGDVIRKGEP